MDLRFSGEIEGTLVPIRDGVMQDAAYVLRRITQRVEKPLLAQIQRLKMPFL
jgi:hypothetical protein